MYIFTDIIIQFTITIEASFFYKYLKNNFIFLKYMHHRMNLIFRNLTYPQIKKKQEGR